MNQKAPKPSLTGHRLKARKRDEKEKYDPLAFRDAILQGFLDCGDDLDKVSLYLDKVSSRLDYRRYAEALFDILFAGGILAPGGSVVEEGELWHTHLCVFSAKEEHLRAHYDVLNKLIRRYKYLEKSFEEELKKLVMFLKGFDAEQRSKLAIVIGLCLANSLTNPTCLTALFEEHIVKEGMAIQFASELFATWLKEKDMNSLGTALKKAEIETRLLDLLPINKRTQENFENHFKAAGLNAIVEYQRNKANAVVRKELQRKLGDMLKDEDSVKEMVEMTKEHMKKCSLSENETIVIVWNTLMGVVEWNKKEELVADQAIRHLKQHASLLKAVSTSGRAQLQLMVKIQDFCYDNMNFLKVFQKIILLLYKMDVLSEDAILKWYRDGHGTKGKSVFLEQMRKFVEWLQNAEEESDEEEEDED